MVKLEHRAPILLFLKSLSWIRLQVLPRVTQQFANCLCRTIGQSFHFFKLRIHFGSVFLLVHNKLVIWPSWSSWPRWSYCRLNSEEFQNFQKIFGIQSNLTVNKTRFLHLIQLSHWPPGPLCRTFSSTRPWSEPLSF